jgi:cytochrome c
VQARYIGPYVNTADTWAETPLHCAADRGCRDEAKLLLDRGADANAKDKSGLTPLRLAAEKSHADLAALLKQHGAEE